MGRKGRTSISVETAGPSYGRRVAEDTPKHLAKIGHSSDTRLRDLLLYKTKPSNTGGQSEMKEESFDRPTSVTGTCYSVDACYPIEQEIGIRFGIALTYSAARDNMAGLSSSTTSLTYSIKPMDRKTSAEDHEQSPSHARLHQAYPDSPPPPTKRPEPSPGTSPQPCIGQRLLQIQPVSAPY